MWTGGVDGKFMFWELDKEFRVTNNEPEVSE